MVVWAKASGWMRSLCKTLWGSIMALATCYAIAVQLPPSKAPELQPSCCETAALTTAPPRHPHLDDSNSNIQTLPVKQGHFAFIGRTLPDGRPGWWPDQCPHQPHLRTHTSAVTEQQVLGRYYGPAKLSGTMCEDSQGSEGQSQPRGALVGPPQQRLSWLPQAGDPQRGKFTDCVWLVAVVRCPALDHRPNMTRIQIYLASKATQNHHQRLSGDILEHIYSYLNKSQNALPNQDWTFVVGYY